MDRNRLIALLSAVGWWVHSWMWINTDQLVRDGDEEGHVGAAELFKDIILERGWFSWIWEAWQGSYGEYPPLFAALVGAWWSFFDVPPSHLLIRGILPLSVFLSALAIARICWRLHREWLLGFLFVLCLPLFNGVARHFMPEAMMAMFSCLSLLFMLKARDNPHWKNALFAGLFIGLGLLCKQSFILIVSLPLLVLWWEVTKRSKFISAGLPLLIAGPWYLKQAVTQSQYLWNSVQSNAELDISAQLLFYPLGICLLGWGILASIAMFWSFSKGCKQELWIWVWLIGGIIILILLPKKYSRLLLAWLPVGGIFICAASKQLPWNGRLGISMLLLSSLGLYSHIKPPNIPFQTRIDDRCAQEWIRPPSTIDLHYDHIIEQVRTAPPGPIVVLNSPNIPCSIQSTHDWGYHLDPYLRRRHLDRDILFTNQEDSNWKNAAVQITWNTATPIDDPRAIQITIQEK